jgi:muramoyltetrapeptide carboxypeptidase
MTPVIRPPALRRGDTIGVVSPSWPALALFPHRGEQARENLRRHWDFRLRWGPHADQASGWVAGSGWERAQDLEELWQDDDVAAIFSAIGGDHSNQLLPYLDWEVFRRRPKIFMGWSDITVLLLAIHRMTGLITFYGPSLVVSLAEFPDVLPYTARALEAVLFRPEPPGVLQPSQQWTEEFLDWATGADRSRARTLLPNPGPVWLRAGTAEGPLVGGCLESLEHLRGTPFWPDFEGRLFFWELSEEAPSPSRVDAMLQDYENMGVFDQIGGMMIGRPYGYTAEDRLRLHQVIRERTARWSFPVLADLDFGHTDPMLTLPIGGRARLGPEGFSLLDGSVRARGPISR